MVRLFSCSVAALSLLTPLIGQPPSEAVTPPLITIAQVPYKVSSVQMVEDQGYDAQAGAFRAIIVLEGSQYMAWYYSGPNVSIGGGQLWLTHLDQPGGSWYSLYNSSSGVTAYVTKVQPF